MDDIDQQIRRERMGLVARSGARAAALFADAGLEAAYEMLRAPEIGSVMVQGRAGGTGGAFNLGEMTVTRCSLKLDGGAVGHGFVQGRDRDAAQAAALLDALMQTDAAPRAEQAVLAPLRAEEQARRKSRAEKAAATKVEFFTMTRGEDD
ncbi:MAG: phosphonate C-P lyase system protein PhnG [Pseudomonadota bacterium]